MADTGERRGDGENPSIDEENEEESPEHCSNGE